MTIRIASPGYALPRAAGRYRIGLARSDCRKWVLTRCGRARLWRGDERQGCAGPPHRPSHPYPSRTERVMLRRQDGSIVAPTVCQHVVPLRKWLTDVWAVATPSLVTPMRRRKPRMQVPTTTTEALASSRRIPVVARRLGQSNGHTSRPAVATRSKRSRPSDVASNRTEKKSSS